MTITLSMKILYAIGYIISYYTLKKIMGKETVTGVQLNRDWEDVILGLVVSLLSWIIPIAYLLYKIPNKYYIKVPKWL